MLDAHSLYMQTLGELDHWPVYVAYPALALFSLGLLLALLTAIP